MTTTTSLSQLGQFFKTLAQRFPNDIAVLDRIFDLMFTFKRGDFFSFTGHFPNMPDPKSPAVIQIMDTLHSHGFINLLFELRNDHGYVIDVFQYELLVPSTFTDPADKLEKPTKPSNIVPLYKML